MIKLSKRLEHIYNLIPSNINVLCDVGCDHGKIIVKSLVENKVKKGIATDISKDSLSKAILLANKEGVDNKIKLYNCYGLYEVNEKCDYTIISGLGGIEISNILKDGYQKSNYFILSPHSDITLVR
ncbi:MAG: class I SAM-dependent methyltransferase [Clostridia bacterium]|nr:class I SAM-dependent methyltransferase [Clostridia bacterium]